MSQPGTDSTPPASLRARSLSASITVRDLATSLSWYRDVVGFTVQDRIERGGRFVGARLVAGDVRILLNQDDGKKGLDRPKGEGISLMITTAERADDVAARIIAAGGTLLSEPVDTPWGARIFRAADPDGFRFAFSSEIASVG